VWGYSRNYTAGDYPGVITGVSFAGGQIELAIRLVVDSFMPSKLKGKTGLGEYKIRFKPNGTKIEGAWQGTFCGEQGKGRVCGTVEPLRPRTAGFARPAPGEHPYLLLRKSDLPALQKKWRSAWGARMAPRLTADDGKSMFRMAVGHGLMYVLTGDTKYAARAQQLIEADVHAGRLVRTEVHHPYVKVHDAGIGAGEAAIAFDLISDACTPEFRKSMTALFAGKAPYLWGCPANGSATSNWSAMYRAGAGMCGLAILNQEEEFWPKPAEPQIARLEADATLASSPPPGAPVAVLESGQPLADWLQAGPLPLGLARDPTEALGGPGARIARGTKVSVRAVLKDKSGSLRTDVVEKAFEPPKPAKGGSPGAFGFSPGGPLGHVTFFYTILENRRPGYYAVDFPSKHQWFLYPYVYINGRRFRSGEHLYLAAGRFAVLAPVQVGHCRYAYTMVWSLALRAAPEQAAQAWLAEEQAAHRLEVAKWQVLHDAARAEGGCNAWGLYWTGVGRQWIENWATWAVGSLGWGMAGEAYTQHSYAAVLPFAHAYRNALGGDLVGRPNLRMALPRYVGQTMFRADGAYLQGYGPGGSALGVDGYARGFGLVPEELKPAVLWGWNRTQRLADEGKLKGPYLTEDFLDPMSAAFMFVNYPSPEGGIAEKNPAEALPKVLLDDWKGGFAFRNRWQDGDDIVAALYLNWNFAGGEWYGAETGEFRISGLGEDWAVRGTGWGVQGKSTGPPAPKRANQNVLELGEPVDSGEAPAFCRFLKASKDGSAVLTLDMDYVYTGDGKAGKSKGLLPPLPIHPRNDAAYAFHDLGLKGIRGFAADYSGASGAPALFAVVDRVAGSAGANRWHLVTEQKHAVEIAGNVFTIRAASGATLKGTVLAPSSPAIAARPQTLGHEAAYDGDHQPREFSRTVLDVPAKDFVFVVMTIQKGEAPAVTVQGAGENARARIGRQTVAFDGAKIVLGQLAGDLQVVGPLAASLSRQTVGTRGEWP
jgi:hypothetical protein